jgi:threonylcarbamoyladenosine tRNA methylthiotransferase MtaB
MKKVAILTLGCKVNQYESACIDSGFQKDGYESVDFDEPADVYVINTCTVTNRTDFKSRNAIRKALEKKKQNPQAKVVVTGCFAQRQYKQVRELGDVDLVVDNQNKDMIPELIEEKQDCFSDIMGYDKFRELAATQMSERSRAFIKVQDGCDYYCTYCAVPYARGHSRSRELVKIKQQISLLVSNGYQEFVLGGINIGLYGRDLEPKTELADLLMMIEGIEGVGQIRISSIEPQLLSSKMWKFIEHSSKLCHHFHISMQSGSDSILEKMKRHYDTNEFRRIIHKIKTIHPDAAIGLDVIIGFPGETVELFNETLHFLEELPFSYLHVFTYSSRPGTEAAAMTNKIHGTISNERNKMLHILSTTKLAAYINWLCNNKILLSGVLESQEGGYWSALSDHFVRLYYKATSREKGDLLKFIPIRPYLDGIEVKLYD